jgi:hypothetical protein
VTRYTSPVVLRFLVRSRAAGLRRGLFPVVLLALASGCKVGGCAANVLGDVVGETGDVYCDRRFVTGDKSPAPFCQEVIDTVAVSQVEDDCRDKHKARTAEGKCPRARIIAGCKLHKDNDDGSEVFDWYYDVSDLEDAAAQEALDAGPDGDDGSDGGITPIFENPVLSKEEVKALCEDKTRYKEGATFRETP